MPKPTQRPLTLLSRLALMAPVAGLAMAAPAAANPTLEPMAVAAAPEIVVVGQGRERLAQSGSSTVIDTQDMERSRPLTVNEALRQTPGLFPRDEEGLGLRPNIGVRGLSPTRSSKVLLLEDGVPLTYAPYSDNATYSHPPFRRFVRIETMKGASQIRFGPNTVGGVVNYITPSAPDRFGGDLFLAGGDDGYFEADAKIGGPLFADFRGIAHINTTQFDGVRANHDLETNDVWGKIEGALAPGHQVSLRLGYATEDSQVSYSGLTTAEYNANPRANPFPFDRFELERFTAAATHAWRIADDLTLTSTGYSLWFDRDWWRQSSNSTQRPADASDPTCGSMANLVTSCGNEGRLREYNVYGLETRLAWTGAVFGADAKVEAGLRRHEERQNRVQINGDTPRARTPGVGINAGVREANKRYADATAAHLATHFTWGGFTLSPGVRVEHVEYERRNLLNNTVGATDLTEVIPSIGFSLEVATNSFVYGGVHRGFAPPRTEDIINTTGGVIDLEPEDSVNWELGFRSAAVDGLFVDVALFRMDFDNQIVPASVAGGVGATLTNGGKTLHQGIEAALNGSLRDMGVMSGDDVFFRTAITYIADAEFAGARTSNIGGFSAVSVSGNRLPYAPKWIASAALGYSFGEVADVQLEVQHTGDQFGDDLNTIAPSADGQRGKIDAATIYNFTVNAKPFGNDTGVFLAVKNLTDELYIVDRSRGIVPGAPRLVQAGVTYRF